MHHLRNNTTKKSRQVSRFSTQKTETELPFQVQSQKTKQFPSTVILHICNPSTWEIKARGSAAQGQPRLHGTLLQTNKAKSCPCSMRGCFKFFHLHLIESWLWNRKRWRLMVHPSLAVWSPTFFSSFILSQPVYFPVRSAWVPC